MTRVTVICGGVGAARFLRGLVQVVDPAHVTAVVNVGDDTVLHGLAVSPDLDTITYTLAGAIDPERGWGLVGETWAAMEQLRRYGTSAQLAGTDEATGWFSLGDRDLGTHLYRTSRRHAGASLSAVTREITDAWGLSLSILPVTDDTIRTELTTVDGERLSFQEYFVRERHDVAIRAVEVVGAERARPAPGVIEAVREADVVVVAPSNPVVSIDPVLAVPGVRDEVRGARARTIAVSPLIGGVALKGPADRLLRELGHEASVGTIARWYAPLASTLVIDDADADHRERVRSAGVDCVVAPTVMSDPSVAAALARRCIEEAR